MVNAINDWSILIYTGFSPVPIVQPRSKTVSTAYLAGERKRSR